LLLSASHIYWIFGKAGSRFFNKVRVFSPQCFLLV
jgi:hypothetical protein